jgi:alcohol dehydrogenase
VVGQFMYERTAPSQLATLAADGLLDLKRIVVTTFPLADFRRAVEAAALMQGLDLTAVVP